MYQVHVSLKVFKTSLKFVYLHTIMSKVLICRDGMAEVNPFLEAMLEILETDDSSEESDCLSLNSDDIQNQDITIGSQGQGQVAVDVPDNSREDPVAPNVHLSPRRSPTVLRYISSSSAKRRMRKQDHCHFCNLSVEKLELEEHLRRSESCKILYFRKLHCKDLNAVLSVLYDCLYCNMERMRLFYHLETNPDCKRQYQDRFSLNSSR